jgi:drug/metabolite transporter (DMT)-like permease
MDITPIAAYLPFLNSIFYAIYYAFLQESYGRLSLSTLLLTNGILFIVLALVATVFRLDSIGFGELRDSKMLSVFLGLIVISTILQATHYIALKNTSATYMAFAEISYPLFVPLFTYFLFNRSELSSSIIIGGGFILLGSYIIAMGGWKST